MTSKYGVLSKTIFVAFLMAVSVNGYAQSMTEGQIIQFVQQEQQKGSDQQTIVAKLLQKGVTVEQLRNIRKKYEAQNSQLGAVDLQNSNGIVNNTAGRMRTNKEKAPEKRNQQNGYMIRSQREEKEAKRMSNEDKLSELNDEIAFMDIDSLIYYQNHFRNDNQVYGRNLFNNKLLTFEPNQNMATPANYLLGAGDKVLIDVWGASQQTFEGTISPDGVIVIDGVGPIKLAGLTVKQATQTVKSHLGRFYSDCSFSLSVGDTRSIQVQVVGDVVMPGTYTLSSLSSAFNALYAAGGISEIGTLRDIKVYRGGRQIATIDVYDYLLNGNQKGDVRLQDNDIIQVGPYECLVNVRGKIKRPMYYEMKRSETVKQLLTYAGGFSGDAYTKNVRLSRKSGQEYSMHTIDEFQMGNFNVMDGDSLYVDSVIARYSNMVEVRGAVKHAGQYQLGGEVQTVRGLLQVAEGLREDAFRNRAVMHREKEDLTLEMLSVDIDGILNGTVADIPLRKGDVLYVPSKVDMKGEQVLKISGEVIYPGTYKFAENTTIEDLILQAGGLTEAASMAKVDVFRRINDVNSTENTGKMAESFSFAIEDGFRINEGGFVLLPYDEVVVRRSPSYSEQKNVTITGCVNFEGQYSMTNKSFRLSDLVKAAGGVTSLAYTKGARLNRVMTPDERLQRESSLRAAQIQLYEEALSSEKNFNKAQADSLLQMKMDLGTTYPVAVNLEKAMANPGCTDDIVLREGDHVEIPQFSNTVKISGEVSYPISMNYKKGESLSYYIKRAGGYGSRAKKKGVYAIYMNGAVEKIGSRSSKSIEPGCEIVVPSKKNNRKMSTSEIVALTSGTASIASIAVALVSLLKK